MINYQKYPSTFHHPSSPGVQSDDKIATKKQLDSFVGEDVVILEKMDGENTTMYGHPDGFHARSIDSAHNWTRDWCKKLHSCIWTDIGARSGKSQTICRPCCPCGYRLARQDKLRILAGCFQPDMKNSTRPRESPWRRA